MHYNIKINIYFLFLYLKSINFILLPIIIILKFAYILQLKILIIINDYTNNKLYYKMKVIIVIFVLDYTTNVKNIIYWIL